VGTAGGDGGGSEPVPGKPPRVMSPNRVGGENGVPVGFSTVTAPSTAVRNGTVSRDGVESSFSWLRSWGLFLFLYVGVLSHSAKPPGRVLLVVVGRPGFQPSGHEQFAGVTCENLTRVQHRSVKTGFRVSNWSSLSSGYPPCARR